MVPKEGTAPLKERNDIARHWTLVPKIWNCFDSHPRTLTELGQNLAAYIMKTMNQRIDHFRILRQQQHNYDYTRGSDKASSYRKRLLKFQHAIQEIYPALMDLKAFLHAKKLKPVLLKIAESTRPTDQMKKPSYQQFWKLPENYDKEAIIERFGTKLGNIFMFIEKLIKRDPTVSILFFSASTQFLNLVHTVLSVNGISSLAVRNTASQRERAILTFKQKRVPILLCCSDGSAAGLNLQEANVIIIADFNHYRSSDKGANEQDQVIGRAWRQGQLKNVKVYRFAIAGTTEESAIESIERKKQNQAAARLDTTNFLDENLFEDPEATGNGNPMTPRPLPFEPMQIQRHDDLISDQPFLLATTNRFAVEEPPPSEDDESTSSAYSDEEDGMEVSSLNVNGSLKRSHSDLESQNDMKRQKVEVFIDPIPEKPIPDTVNPNYVQDLMRMGFPRNEAIAALMIHRNDVTRAFEHLWSGQFPNYFRTI